MCVRACVRACVCACVLVNTMLKFDCVHHIMSMHLDENVFSSSSSIIQHLVSTTQIKSNVCFVHVNFKHLR